MKTFIAITLTLARSNKLYVIKASFGGIGSVYGGIIRWARPL